MERVLFISSTRIGDAVIHSGVLNHLVETRPQARFTIACGHLAEPIYVGVPRLERLIVMRKKGFGGHWFDLWKQVAGTQWDLVVDMRSSATAWFLRTRERGILGQSTRIENKVCESASALKLDPPPSPKIHLLDAVRQSAAGHFPADCPTLALCPSASLPFKMWPGERFAELAERLISSDGALAGAHVAIFGGPGDGPAADALHARLPAERITDLTGKLALDEVAACVSQARLFIGNDSGVMHIAAAMGVPTLGLFGPSDERLYGPWGAHCTTVRGPASFSDIQATHPDWKAHPSSLLDDLSVDAAYEAAHTLLERTSS